MPASLSPPAVAAEAIDRPARRLSRTCLVLAFVLVPAVAAVLALGWPESLSSAMPELGANVDLANLPRWRSGLIFVLALIPALLMASALLEAGRCLAAFARRQYFSAETVRHMRRFSACVFWAAISGVGVPTLVILIATTAGPGPATLTISLGSDDLFLLLFSGISWQIASVLGRAVALAEDHAQIV